MKIKIKTSCECENCLNVYKYQKCQKEVGHRWYATDELYEKCQNCDWQRLIVSEDTSIIHVKKKRGDK